VNAFSRLGPHLRRLRERGSARLIAEAIAREARIRGEARLTHARVARARRGNGQVVVGPFFGEIGFEVLYWVPFLRRLLAGIDPSRVTAISRGGTESWYRGIADGYVDLFDLYSPEEYGDRLAARRREAGDSKQLTELAFDREVLDRAGEHGAVAVHPSLLFTRLRYFWAGERPLETVLGSSAYRRLEAPAAPPGLPERYVAVKAYYSDCLPDSGGNREYLRELVTALSGGGEVVLLPSSFRFDDHRAPAAAELSGVRTLPEAEDPRTNLAVQTAVIANAQGLVGTYGGFSYLAPMLGVRSSTVFSEHNFNTTHLEVLSAATAQIGGDHAVGDVADTAPADLAAAVWSNPRG
jgi:hypothetical protein